MFSRKVKIFAASGLVAVVAGICAGAGVLIYQSTSGRTNSVEVAATGTSTLRELFPDAKEFTHYPFLNYVKTSELDLSAIADIGHYATDKQKAFSADVAKVGRLVFANALANAKYWGSWGKYQSSPGLFKTTTKVQRVTDSELYMAAGLTDANGMTWYDIGRIAL